jgi:phosphoglycerate dehydrogenase-like enzyme
LTKILTPPQPAPILEVARELLPPGLELVVVDPTRPELLPLPNVTLTPHSAGPTWDNWARAYRNGFDNIQRVQAGRDPLWVLPELRS